MDEFWKRYRPSDPNTSMEAAKEAKISKRQQQVIDIMKTDPARGWIADDIDRHPKGEYGLWRRFNELRNAGAIEVRTGYDGEEITRAGYSGKQQRVHWLRHPPFRVVEG